MKTKTLRDEDSAVLRKKIEDMKKKGWVQKRDIEQRQEGRIFSAKRKIWYLVQMEKTD